MICFIDHIFKAYVEIIWVCESLSDKIKFLLYRFEELSSVYHFISGVFPLTSMFIWKFYR